MQEITKRVILGQRHANYTRTVEVMNSYNMYAFGIGIDKLITSLREQETKEEEDQRVRLTQFRTGAEVARNANQIKRVFRADKQKFEYSSKEEVTKAISVYTNQLGSNGEQLLDYIESESLLQNTVDPNSVTWIKYYNNPQGDDSFNPSLFSSKNVYWINKNKGAIVEAVLFNLDSVSYFKEKKLQAKDVPVYYTFEPNGLYYVTFELIKDILDNSNYYDAYNFEQAVSSEMIEEKIYYTFAYENPLDFLPLHQYGYLKDPITNNTSFVSYWHNAMPNYKELVDLGSMKDITTFLHTFPMRYEYYQPCDYVDIHSGNQCKGGTLQPSGNSCHVCKGTGGKTMTSGQSVIQLAIKDGENNIKPSDLAAYSTPPIEILKVQIEELDKMSGKISKTIFGVDLNTKSNVAVTATENQNYYDTAYDVLYDFTQSPVAAFDFFIRVIADTKNIKDVAPRLVYTNNYNLETEADLLMLRKVATDANANPETLESIDKRILLKQNKHNTAFMKVHDVMRKFLPFSSVDNELKSSIIQSLPSKSLQRTLALNFSQITNDIRFKYPMFTLKTHDEQKKIVDDVTQIYIDLALESESIVESIDRSEIV